MSGSVHAHDRQRAEQVRKVAEALAKVGPITRFGDDNPPYPVEVITTPVLAHSSRDPRFVSFCAGDACPVCARVRDEGQA